MEDKSPEPTELPERRANLTETLLEVFATQQAALSETFIKQQQAFGETVMAEVRATRRNANWRTAIIVLGVIALMLFNLYSAQKKGALIPDGEEYVSLVRLTGAIESGAKLSFENLESVLYDAFHDEESKGVLLLVNSPGGTPVQSQILYDYLLKLKEETQKKLVVLGEDYLTSGAYLMAMSADKLFVHPATMTGSVGVFQQSFGFADLADRLGIEARTIYAGEHKRRLDPFTEASAGDIEKTQDVLNQIHRQFIAIVKSGRGELKNPGRVFSGDYWTGDQAVEMGLADHVATYYDVLNHEFKVEHAKDYTPGKTIFSRISESMVSVLAMSLQDTFSL